MSVSVQDEDNFLKLSQEPTPRSILDKAMSDDYFTASTNIESPNKQSEVDTNVYYGLTGCICSMLCLIIGCGIISMPYSAAIVNSIWISLAVNLLSVALILVAAMIYLKVRENIIFLYF